MAVNIVISISSYFFILRSQSYKNIPSNFLEEYVSLGHWATALFHNQYNISFMRTYLFIILLTSLFMLPSVNASPDSKDKKWPDHRKTIIYKFDIGREIGPAAWRITQQSFREANAQKADLVLIHLNTYGGMLDAADSIRTIILNSVIPVYVFIDNNAASAGALISIAADRIYMRDGASIGAATVVNQTGAAMPDKYQSFMRSMMRATAESHGRDTIIKGKDTIVSWRRDPRIAEAMVDPRTYIAGVNDSGKVLTFTTEEAIRHGYCEGKANSISEVIRKANISNYEIKEYKLTNLEKFIGFLINPVVQGFLIMIIIAGIYFELQTPGVTFPMLLAVAAAVLYFAPLYLDGLAQHWEIIVFIIGIILILIEVFAIPGFGFTGISGIALVIVGLTFGMIDNNIFETGGGKALSIIFKSLFLVVISIAVSLVSSIYISGKLITSSRLQGLALKSEQKSDQGYVSGGDNSYLIGKEGTAVTMLRPSGKVDITGEIYDALSEVGYIDPGERVVINRYEAGQLYVSKKDAL
jgi:membrane-bound serine protease (ClpP class)